jgi:hypothetical protein
MSQVASYVDSPRSPPPPAPAPASPAPKTQQEMPLRRRPSLLRYGPEYSLINSFISFGHAKGERTDSTLFFGRERTEANLRDEGRKFVSLFFFLTRTKTSLLISLSIALAHARRSRDPIRFIIFVCLLSLLLKKYSKESHISIYI